MLLIMVLTKAFSIITASANKVTITRHQVPVTLAYAFTDYRSQAQSITALLTLPHLRPASSHLSESWERQHPASAQFSLSIYLLILANTYALKTNGCGLQDKNEMK